MKFFFSFIIFWSNSYFCQVEIRPWRVTVDSQCNQVIRNSANFELDVVEENQILYFPNIRKYRLIITSLNKDGTCQINEYNTEKKLKKIDDSHSFTRFTQNWLLDNGVLYAQMGSKLINFGKLNTIETNDISVFDLKRNIYGVKILNNKLHGYLELKGNQQKENVRIYSIDLLTKEVEKKDVYIQNFFLNQQSPSCYIDFFSSFYTIVEPLNYSIYMFNYSHELIDSLTCTNFENSISREDIITMNEIEISPIRDATNFSFYSKLINQYNKIWMCKIIDEKTLWVRFTRPDSLNFTFVDHIWQKNIDGNYILVHEIDTKQYTNHFSDKFDLNSIWFSFIGGTRCFLIGNVIYLFAPSNKGYSGDYEKVSDFYGETVLSESDIQYSLIMFTF